MRGFGKLWFNKKKLDGLSMPGWNILFMINILVIIVPLTMKKELIIDLS